MKQCTVKCKQNVQIINITDDIMGTIWLVFFGKALCCSQCSVSLQCVNILDKKISKVQSSLLLSEPRTCQHSKQPKFNKVHVTIKKNSGRLQN